MPRPASARTRTTGAGAECPRTFFMTMKDKDQGVPDPRNAPGEPQLRSSAFQKISIAVKHFNVLEPARGLEPRAC